MNSWRRPDGTVAAVVLILFRQQRRHKQRAEDPAPNAAIGCSDLFRVIVLHGVFVPGTLQRCNGCGPDGRDDASETARTHLGHSARIRHYSLGPALSRAPFSNVNPAHTGCDGITNSERTVNTGTRLVWNNARKKCQWNDDHAIRPFWRFMPRNIGIDM